MNRVHSWGQINIRMYQYINSCRTNFCFVKKAWEIALAPMSLPWEEQTRTPDCHHLKRKTVWNESHTQSCCIFQRKSLFLCTDEFTVGEEQTSTTLLTVIISSERPSETNRIRRIAGSFRGSHSFFICHEHPLRQSKWIQALITLVQGE